MVKFRRQVACLFCGVKLSSTMCMQNSTRYNVRWIAAGVPVLKEKKSESLSQRHIGLVGKNVPTPLPF